MADDLVEIVEDDRMAGVPAAAAGPPPWQVLIVDDENQVHQATLFALSGITVDGRGLAFLHAHSARQARELLARHPDVAVVLLDVVMESEDAGLQLARHIRETLRMTSLRIVLRTGQPGYAPEMQVVQDYDINDYRTKAELTRTRLVTTITAAIRSYRQFSTIEEGRRGIRKVLEEGARLLACRTIPSFCDGVLAGLARVLGVEPDGLVVSCGPGAAGAADGAAAFVQGAAGRCRPLVGLPVAGLADPDIEAVVRRTLETGAGIPGVPWTTLHLRGRSGPDAVVAIRTSAPVGAVESRLYELYGANAAIGFENVVLFHRLHESAYLDPLSGLPNRTRFVELIDEQIGRSRPGWVVGILDVDHFSEINDGLGHVNGDALLKSIAARLRGALDETVAVARVSGDTFGLFGTEDMLDPERLLGLFEQPFAVDGYALQVSASLGLVRGGETGGDGLDALKNANLALTQAKRRARGRYHYFTRAMEVGTRERIRLAHDLRRSIEAGELHLVYQPQVELATGRVVGAEALLRWTTADGRAIAPERFVPVAEYSGLIRPIGEWVLRSACRQLRAWNDQGLRGFRVAVNVSLDQFRAPDFPALVESVIREAGVEPSEIELEITESMAMEEIGIVTDTLVRLKAIGVAVAIDDFGTGFSSLGHLQQLSVDRLKIDRRFVGELTASGGRASIPETIVRLGHGLGLQVIAEGVETEQHAAALRALGCDEAQGYLFCRPVAVDAFERWLSGQGVPVGAARAPDGAR